MARCGCSSFFQHCAEAELVLWFTPWLCDLEESCSVSEPWLGGGRNRIVVETASGG